MNKSEIFKSIQREYDREKTDAEYAAEKRRIFVCKQIPRLYEIQREINNSGTTLAEIFLNDGDKIKSLADFREKCKRLNDEKTRLLVENGYSPDYMEPQYKCKKCSDTGYVDDKRCECFRKKLIKYYYNMSNIADMVSIENFDNFNLNMFSESIIENGISARKNIENIVKRVIEDISMIDNIPMNLVFYGQSGLGKTYMCNCIAKELMDKEMTVIYMSAYELFNTLIKERFAHNYAGDKLSLLNSCDLLVIDDLGTEGTNHNTITEFFNILNARLLNKKSTIISTNMTPNELTGVYTERIVSRLIGNYKFYKFFGRDIRVFK